MKIYTPPPPLPDVYTLRITVFRNNSEHCYLVLEDCDLQDAIQWAKNALKPHADPFAGKEHATRVNFQKAVNGSIVGKAGTAASFSLKGISPKDVIEILKKATQP